MIPSCALARRAIEKSNNCNTFGHHFPACDWDVLAKLIPLTPMTEWGRIAVEVGCFVCQTSLRMLAFGATGVYAVDCFDGGPQEEGRLKVYDDTEALGEDEDEIFRQANANTYECPIEILDLTSDEARWEIQKRYNFPIHKPLSFVFIDACKSQTFDDFERWYPLLTPGGIIAGHDFKVFKEVDDAVNKIMDLGHDVSWHKGSNVWYTVKPRG